MALKAKIENIDFHKFEQLKKLLVSDDFDAKKFDQLDLSGYKAINLPPIQSLKLLYNIKIINLRYNCISRFDGNIFVEGAPQLQNIDLSSNKIGILDDLMELGKLKDLRVLNFTKNPIAV